MADRKVVAESLKTILDTPVMRAIQDRTVDVVPAARTMNEHWSLDLFSRKPGPAANSLGEFVGTDLDLSTFLSALQQRQAVINIPTYKGMRGASTKANERVVSKENRHGNIIGLYSNKEVFTFGVRILDMNVITQDPVTGRERAGAPRNFALVDVEGKWHDGWRTIEFSPTAKENQFLNDRKIWSGSSVVVKFFCHPQRWQSLYGAPYFMAKAMVERLTDEARHIRAEIKRLQANGVKFPPKEGGESFEISYEPSTPTGETTKIEVRAFQVEIDLPEPTGVYPAVEATSAALQAASDRLKEITYGLRDPLSFATRSVELAFARHGFSIAGAKMDDPDYIIALEGADERMPGWIDAKWEREYVLPGKRNKWSRLVLFQPAVGQQGVALRYRTWSKTEHVAADTKLAAATV